MYKELKIDYERKLSWAKSLGIDPLADGFDPTVPAPPELSSWLHLFHSYLQLEEAYRETLDWLNFIGKRLIDPEPRSKPFIEEAQEIWKDLVWCFTSSHSTPYSDGIRRKRCF
ncbi:g2296 [Coccomyxa viridis]|uniref:G2296 protein n=1 Tax=Coccomyxa viridis TaxID=1274662 RepID=A0ABP1FK22_9CHLO